MAENGTIIVNHTGFFSCFDSVPRVGIAPLLTRILQRKGKKNPLFSFLNCPAIFPKLTIIFSLTFFFFYCFRHDRSLPSKSLQICVGSRIDIRVEKRTNFDTRQSYFFVDSLIDQSWFVQFREEKERGKKETDVSGHVDS